ncbi:CopD family protein [Pseudomonas sp. efr-133-TYG-103a]|uniref:CopD family protein n=1 Tax=Pseudomonas sp. efr-133-TYG-103a TaxID=3040308 RepID=UPI0025571AB2|nr:CopD family protein [Pseudomonas sp. efr-133-TYG-103a]
MSLVAFVYAMHVLAAVLWVGGMFFAWMILRPAVIAALEGPARLKLWVQVFPRFFIWVWGAVILLPVTGIGMININFSGLQTAPRYVQVMIGLYVVMVALFLRISTLNLPELRKAVAAEQWPDGAAALGKIRRLLGINLLVGIAVIAIAAARPGF